MDEFVVFLIVGLLAITAMAMVFVGDFGFLQTGGNGYNYYNYNRTYQTTTTSTVPVVGRNGDLLIGPQNIATWRSVMLGDVNASYLSGNVEYNVSEKYLFNGLLFGGNDLRIDTQIDTTDFIGSYIRFDVDKSNSYGNLLVKFNGNVVANKVFTPGTNEIIINNSYVGKTNTIEFIPVSSYWKIWAPNVYNLKNVDIVFQNHYAKPSQFRFNIYQDEANKLTKDNGMLLLDFPNHSGVLKIKLNGNQIYSNQSSGYQYVPFNQANLKYGENVLDFYADQNSNFQGKATLIFYYSTTKENSVTKDFTVNQSRFDRLNLTNGQFVFNITAIPVSGGFSLDIENKNGNKTMQVYATAENKTYIYNFNSTQCIVGTNTVRIKSIDNSVFYIDELKINI